MSNIEGFGGALDLSDANTKGFDPLDSGTYDCELFEYEWAETKGGEGSKMPGGTPMLKLQFRVIEEQFENRRLFDQFVIPPADYDKEKAATMKGMLVRFLTAMGLDESDVTTKKFNLNETLDNLVGEPVRCTVGQEEQKVGVNAGRINNPIKGYKSAGESEDSSNRLL